MHSTPPFPPPYFTTGTSESGALVIETLEDGSTRTVIARERPQILPASQLATASQASDTVGQLAKVKPRASGSKNAAVVLEVAFADKEKAKTLGARWDATKKKWYVPHGVDLQLFKRWWPADMND